MTDQVFFANATLDALLCVFANIKTFEERIFEVTSSYKESKFASIELNDKLYEQNNQLLNDYYHMPFSYKGIKHSFFIESEQPIEIFLKKVYDLIQQKRVEENISNDDFENKILLAFFGLRGSVDFTRNYFAVDLIRDIVNDVYLDNLFKLLTNISDLRQLNLNFRELQEQYISGKNKRNTQFRINLRYFYDRLKNELSKINIYKSNILLSNKKIIQTKNISQNDKTPFIDRVLFYGKKVLNNSIITENEAEKLRKELGFDYNESLDNKISRNQGIVKYVRIFFDDVCVACKDEFSIENRTFKYKNSDRYYLEIHHCISFSADNTCDQIDNLVKLCPSCHRALTKNRADEIYQKHLISNILKNSPKTQEFCFNFLSEDATNTDVIDFIYDRLR